MGKYLRPLPVTLGVLPLLVVIAYFLVVLVHQTQPPLERQWVAPTYTPLTEADKAELFRQNPGHPVRRKDALETLLDSPHPARPQVR